MQWYDRTAARESLVYNGVDQRSYTAGTARDDDDATFVAIAAASEADVHWLVTDSLYCDSPLECHTHARTQ